MNYGANKMPNISGVMQVQKELIGHFEILTRVQTEIRKFLLSHADGKILKGNELVGWLGEIYGKILYGGKLVSDANEHDLETCDGMKISVKTRKGWRSGWKQSSSIPKVEGYGCPTHLLFVHLNDDYTIDRIWLYEWAKLFVAGRFKSHKVRGTHRSFIFTVDEHKDNGYIVCDFSR